MRYLESFGCIVSILKFGGSDFFHCLRSDSHLVAYDSSTASFNGPLETSVSKGMLFRMLVHS